LLFVAWLDLFVFCATLWLLRIRIGLGRNLSFAASVVVAAVATLCTFDFKLFHEILVQGDNPKTIAYFATTLAVGLPILYTTKSIKEGGIVPLVMVRKLFHILAFILFAPIHLKMHKSRETFAFLVLAQNLVSVVFIFIEITRFTYQG